MSSGRMHLPNQRHEIAEGAPRRDALRRDVEMDALRPTGMPGARAVNAGASNRAWRRGACTCLAACFLIAGDASGLRLWILLTSPRSVARDQERSAGSTATEYSWGADIPDGHCTTLNRYGASPREWGGEGEGHG